jgi:IS5 family transposase
MDILEVLGTLPEQISVHLDRGYDSQTTREKLKIRGMAPRSPKKVSQLL